MPFVPIPPPLLVCPAAAAAGSRRRRWRGAPAPSTLPVGPAVSVFGWQAPLPGSGALCAAARPATAWADAVPLPSPRGSGQRPAAVGAGAAVGAAMPAPRPPQPPPRPPLALAVTRLVATVAFPRRQACQRMRAACATRWPRPAFPVPSLAFAERRRLIGASAAASTAAVVTPRGPPSTVARSRARTSAFPPSPGIFPPGSRGPRWRRGISGGTTPRLPRARVGVGCTEPPSPHIRDEELDACSRRGVPREGPHRQIRPPRGCAPCRGARGESREVPNGGMLRHGP